MRRAAVLAILLVLALGGVAQAKPPIASVTGTYTYEIAGVPRTTTVDARNHPVTGTFSRNTLVGSVTCLVVDDHDAWIAGSITDSELSVFLWVRDGDLPDGAGDMAVAWITDPGQSLKDMERLCKQKSTTLTDLFPVVAGDIFVKSR